MKPAGAILAISMLSGALFSATSLADEYEDQVDGLLDVLEAMVEDDGYESSHDRYINGLDEGSSKYLNVDLKKGRRYILGAVCDYDCSDVDITLLDRDGDVLVKDTDETDLAVIEYRPWRSGEYEVKVKMYECSNEPCYYGVSVFSR